MAIKGILGLTKSTTGGAGKTEEVKVLICQACHSRQFSFAVATKDSRFLIRCANCGRIVEVDDLKELVEFIASFPEGY